MPELKKFRLIYHASLEGESRVFHYISGCAVSVAADPPFCVARAGFVMRFSRYEPCNKIGSNDCLLAIFNLDVFARTRKKI